MVNEFQELKLSSTAKGHFSWPIGESPLDLSFCGETDVATSV
jgi:hypothetical protein